VYALLLYCRLNQDQMWWTGLAKISTSSLFHCKFRNPPLELKLNGRYSWVTEDKSTAETKYLFGYEADEYNKSALLGLWVSPFGIAAVHPLI
jgi:hypothetical protein